MKAVIKSNDSGTGVAQENIIWTDFNDRAIDKLFIKVEIELQLNSEIYLFLI